MERIPLRKAMGRSGAGDGGGLTFGAGDDAGGSMIVGAGETGARLWYVMRGGGVEVTRGVGTMGGTSSGMFSTVEEKKGVVSKKVTSAETRYR